MRSRLTVIVPIYNVESYIAECLDSLVQQTIGIHQLEVIIVNDASSDRSMEIVRNYMDRYDCIRVFEHDRNKGTAAARNLGVQMATSPYIAFLDGDDFLSPNTLEAALNRLEQDGSDLVLYEYEYYSASGRIYPRNPSARLFVQDRAITNLMEVPEIIFAMSVCNKLFKKELLVNNPFPQSRMEDVIVSTLATFRAGKISITNKGKYYYRKREDDRQQSKTDMYYQDKQYFYDHLEANETMYRLISRYPDYKCMIDWFNARSIQPFLYRMLLNRHFSLQERKSYFKRAKKLLAEIDDTTINRIEHIYARDVLRLARDASFYGFHIRLVGGKLREKIKAVFAKNGKAFKLLEMITAVMLSNIYRLNKRYNNVWLVCERGDEARDNGFWMFKYLRENAPDLNVYYLISSQAGTDYEKVSALGNVVEYRSFKHKVLFVLARKLITAHNGTIEPWNYKKFMRVFGSFVGKKHYIFLQHGITKDDVSNVLGRSNTPFDLFITGGKPEYDYISNCFGYTSREVAYTGFARFDALPVNEVSTKKQLLLMPTWRKSITWIPESESKEVVFRNSEYFRRYQSFINSKDLLEWLEKYDYEMVFYPHYEAQPFLHLFQSHSERIVLADKSRYDVQRLLIESEVLITDFSSVFFDFAYMMKPVVYYQFDQDDFFRSHYRKGYFEYERDGFGPVLTTEQAVIDWIKSEQTISFRMRLPYSERVKQFFTLRDGNNSRRIYKAIQQMN